MLTAQQAEPTVAIQYMWTTGLNENASIALATALQVAWFMQGKLKYAPNTILLNQEEGQAKMKIIGASLSEPHTSMTSLCMCVCVLACLQPRT